MCPEEKWLVLNSILHRSEKKFIPISNITFISKELVILFLFLKYDIKYFYVSLWIIAKIICIETFYLLSKVFLSYILC